MNIKNSSFARIGFIALFLSLSVFGFSRQAWSESYTQMGDQVAQFHQFMMDHPSVAADLQKNPQLVNDRKYLDKHDEVKDYLKKHPAVKQEIAQHPRRVFGRYYIDDRHEYSDNRPEHRWDYHWNERDHDRHVNR